MEPQDQREQLFERAKVGEITGEEADAEAIRLGLGSLSSQPGPDAYRPEGMAYWTIPMVLAWIVYLDFEEVRDWYGPYRAECWHWIHRQWRVGLDGPVHTGWLLEERLPPTLSLFSTSLAFDKVEGEGPLPTMSAREARESLWIMLRDGFLKASGIDMGTGRRVEIPSLDWHELVPVQGRGEVDEVRRGLLGDGYREVLIPSAPVRRHWRRVEKPRLIPTETMAPVGHGYMPLYCAAQWIATAGGRRDFDPDDLEQWRPAYRDLVAAISSDAIRIVGVTGSETKPVPAHLFAGIRVKHPYEDMALDLILSNELVLVSLPYIDEEHWLGGFSDALTDRRGDHWSRLMVEKSGVRTLWPFDDAPPRSGAPGRPTSAHLFVPEMERRAAHGELSSTLAGETRYLSQWLKDQHPDMPQALPGSIEEVIRARYWKLRGRN
ncbi:MAG: hypothetical protein EOP21_01480 [Hyphomicrobiales bacterium]|nr:MAG: hypothetical protein EOP21_01480 [Hyphomicrobiales bacterium]